MQDGRPNLAHTPEHAVELDTGTSVPPTSSRRSSISAARIIGFLLGCLRPSWRNNLKLLRFSIETIARYSRDKTKVPDRCAMCQKPLYCPSCEKLSTHFT